MQKDLVTATSLFCDAGTPISGAATGAHDGYNHDFIRTRFEKDRIGKASIDHTTANVLVADRKAKRMPGDFRYGGFNLAVKPRAETLLKIFVSLLGFDEFPSGAA